MIHRHRGVLRSHVFFSPLILFCFRILVFHLKQEHEEGQRLLHYLQQTNTQLAMCKCICVRYKETCQMKWKLCLLCFHRKVQNYLVTCGCMTGLKNACNQYICIIIIFFQIQGITEIQFVSLFATSGENYEFVDTTNIVLMVEFI